jgi:hypothetical protein
VYLPEVASAAGAPRGGATVVVAGNSAWPRNSAPNSRAAPVSAAALNASAAASKIVHFIASPPWHF